MRWPFAREGAPFLVSATVILLLSFRWGGLIELLAWLAAIFVFNFFRDPERACNAGPEAIVAPADGRVIKAERVSQNPFTEGDALLISIFMSPLNVHVNRIPIDGTVVAARHQPGEFFRADAEEARLHNEHNAVTVEDPQGRRICFVQVAGFVARRIVCHVQPGDAVRRGERYGMIRFGSRADIYLPPNAQAAVSVGDRTTAGVSTIARWV